VQIIGPHSLESQAFMIYPGKQITLHATGLFGDDKVIIEIVELSKAPDFKGNPCCDLAAINIEVLAAVQLKCANGNRAELTAEYPWFVVEAPQNVTLRARVEADPGASISVDLTETDSDGCLSCTCRCVDDVWTPTGDFRCEGDNVEKKETSNCGTVRWVIDRPQTWTRNGVKVCGETLQSFQEVNDCGEIRWVDGEPVTWVETGTLHCDDDTGRVNAQEVNDCGDFRWVDKEEIKWWETGEIRCIDHAVDVQERNQCGITRWYSTDAACNYCASYPIPYDLCDDHSGYAFVEGDLRDPNANVLLSDCDGVPLLYLYPTAGPDHSIPVNDCSGALIGYGVNKSDCAGQVPTAIKFMNSLSVSHLPELKIPKRVVSALHVGSILYYIWSDGSRTQEELPAQAPVVTNVSWSGDNILVTYSDGSTVTRTTPVC
jgi:hypothetical protein